MHDDILGSQLTTAAVAVWIIQKLKQCPRLPFIHQASDRVNVAVSVLIATLATVGIHFSFDADAGTLMVTGLTAANGIHLGVEVFKTFVLQATVYHGVVKK